MVFIIKKKKTTTAWVLKCFSLTLILKFSSLCQQTLKYPNEYFTIFYFTNERPEGKRLAQSHRASWRPGWEEDLGVLNHPTEFILNYFPSAAIWCVFSRGRVSPSQSGKAFPEEDILISFSRTAGWRSSDESILTFPSPVLSLREYPAPSWLFHLS